MPNVIVAQASAPLQLRLNGSSPEPFISLNNTKNPPPILLPSPNESDDLTNSVNGVLIAEVESASIVDLLSIDQTPTSATIKKKTQSAVPKLYRKSNSTKQKLENKVEVVNTESSRDIWKCPNITSTRNLECGCDMPHTLRCSGDIHSLAVIHALFQNLNRNKTMNIIYRKSRIRSDKLLMPCRCWTAR